MKSPINVRSDEIPLKVENGENHMHVSIVSIQHRLDASLKAHPPRIRAQKRGAVSVAN